MIADSILLVIPIILGLMLWSYLSERREWNKGTCRICKTKWVKPIPLPIGGTGYQCKFGHWNWISRPGIDRQ